MARTESRPSRHGRRGDETSAEAVARYTRRLIFEGRLVAGQRLPQDEIADAVGVSRIPVREAIIALEREGWVRVESHRGAFVTPFDDRSVLDRFELYARFYGFASRRVVEHASESELAGLRRLAGRVTAATTAARMDKANLDYLTDLVQHARSDRLRAVLRSTTQIVPGSFFATVPNAVTIQRAGVAEIQDALEARAAERLQPLWSDMERRLALEVIALLRSRDEPGRQEGNDG